MTCVRHLDEQERYVEIKVLLISHLYVLDFVEVSSVLSLANAPASSY